MLNLRYVGRSDGAARGGVPGQSTAAEGADRGRSLGQHGDSGQHHSAARGLHQRSPDMCQDAAGGRSTGEMNLQHLVPAPGPGPGQSLKRILPQGFCYSFRMKED